MFLFSKLLEQPCLKFSSFSPKVFFLIILTIQVIINEVKCWKDGGGLIAKSCLTLATPWTINCQAPLFMGFFRQEYWSGLPFSSSGDLLNPRIKPRSPALKADSLPTEL